MVLDAGWWDMLPKLKASPPGQPVYDLVMTDPTQGQPAITVARGRGPAVRVHHLGQRVRDGAVPGDPPDADAARGVWPQIRYLLTPVVAAASSVTVALTLAVLAAASRLGGVRDLLAAR